MHECLWVGYIISQHSVQEYFAHNRQAGAQNSREVVRKGRFLFKPVKIEVTEQNGKNNQVNKPKIMTLCKQVFATGQPNQPKEDILKMSMEFNVVLDSIDDKCTLKHSLKYLIFVFNRAKKLIQV